MDKRNKDGSPTLARTIRAIVPGAKQQCPVSVTFVLIITIVRFCEIFSWDKI